jgi:tetratricopeptide (TPR) repeat protein
MGDGRADELRYTAFLSYSHKDSTAAGRLHRRLETYRMPKRLVGAETPRGPVPARLAPIFRDREELPAATDLSATVREALALSGALIVLCSPHAAASLWVAEEIETFRKLHPDRPILAAILDGDPSDCFPAVLRALGRDGTWHEPLATDLRRHCDGQRLGMLKLVAGITGVGLDALVQRDASRRIRRVMAVTAAALVAMLAMAALALVAINARGEADRQRAETERQRAAAAGLVEFMLTDLRTRLRGVGRLDIMLAVNRRALAFYGGQQALDGRPADAAAYARVLHALGEDDLGKGDERAALANFREARRITATLIGQWPDDLNIIFAHAQSDYWIGRVHEYREDWPAAERQYGLYAAAARRLIARAPRNPDYMNEMAFGAAAQGRVRLGGRGDSIGAERLFRQSIHWFEAAIRARPGEDEYRIALANAYANLADSFYPRRLWRQSLAFRLRQYDIVVRLQRADPDNALKLFRLGLAERAVAAMSSLAGDQGKVGLFLGRSYQTARTLTALDPANADWLLFRLYVECGLAGTPSQRPAGLSAGTLRSSIAAGVAQLIEQRNPRVATLSACRNRLGI